MRYFLLVALVLVVGCVGPLAQVLPPREKSGAPTLAGEQFALEMYRELGKVEGNVFFSPSCIREALAMAHAGARGETAREMATVLHLPDDPVQARRALAGLRPRVGLLSGVHLHQAASVWGQRGLGFQRGYLGLLGEGYGAEIHEVDFAQGENARQTINAWVERQTAHRIKDLFKRGSLNQATRLALVSAIHFKADWAKPFSKEATRDERFHVSRTQQTSVKMMQQTETFPYTEFAGGQLLEMPYVGKEFVIQVLLPEAVDGLATLERTLTAERWRDLASQLQPQKVVVHFPRFEMTSDVELNQTLGQLGMPLAFTPAADFSGMNGGKERLFISTAVHKAWIELNELGTEAAAATGVAMALSSANGPRPKPDPVFRADHPFLFAIRDARTGAILFLGRYARP